MFKSLCNLINKITDYLGRLGALLIFILAVLLGYDVIMRYIFNNPTSWVLDITQSVDMSI
jgi:TRAP-type mannitol/chloroaromatic compound transport system permease small subunit